MQKRGAFAATVLIMLTHFARTQGFYLAFNNKLQADTRNNVQEAGLKEHLEVLTIHASARLYYGAQDADTDAGLKRVCRDSVSLLPSQAKELAESTEIVYLDEVQDFHPALRDFVIKLIGDINIERSDLRLPEVQVAVLGDRAQTVYDVRAGGEGGFLSSIRARAAPGRARPMHCLSGTRTYLSSRPDSCSLPVPPRAVQGSDPRAARRRPESPHHHHARLGRASAPDGLAPAARCATTICLPLLSILPCCSLSRLDLRVVY